MTLQPSDRELLSVTAAAAGETEEADLWFLPGPPEAEPDFLPPGPRAEPDETSVLEGWRRAEATQAALLARVAMRLGALDERLLRGPAGWRHRLALAEAAELGWFAGRRIAPDRLALWIALRSGSIEDEDTGMSKTGWAYRRLSGGPGPERGLAAFLGRHDAAAGAEASLGDRIDGWAEMVERAGGLHPITRAGLGFYLWPMAGIGPESERLEAAVTAARIAAADCRGGLVFAPLAAGGAIGLRAGGEPHRRLKLWLDGMESAAGATMRLLDQLEDWQRRAEAATADLSGRTPPRLISALVEWPLVSAPMAEEISQGSRAAVQRNLSVLERRGVVKEITGQGRFRFWRCAL